MNPSSGGGAQAFGGYPEVAEGDDNAGGADDGGWGLPDATEDLDDNNYGGGGGEEEDDETTPTPRESEMHQDGDANGWGPGEGEVASAVEAEDDGGWGVNNTEVRTHFDLLIYGNF